VWEAERRRLRSPASSCTDVAFPPHTNHDFTYTYGGAGPHQATQIGETFLTYDGNGNTTSECRDHADPTCSVNRDHHREYRWTEENRLASVIPREQRSPMQADITTVNSGAYLTLPEFTTIENVTLVKETNVRYTLEGAQAGDTLVWPGHHVATYVRVSRVPSSRPTADRTTAGSPTGRER
jgi:hypothetical protein